jgi:hypothetical protein
MVVKHPNIGEGARKELKFEYIIFKTAILIGVAIFSFIIGFNMVVTHPSLVQGISESARQEITSNLVVPNVGCMMILVTAIIIFGVVDTYVYDPTRTEPSNQKSGKIKKKI